MKKGNFTMNTFNNSRRSFIKNAGVLAIGGTLPVSLVEMAMAACDLNFTLPTPVLLEPFDSLTGFTFSGNWLNTTIRTCKWKPDIIKPGNWLPGFFYVFSVISAIEVSCKILKVLSRMVLKTDFNLQLSSFLQNSQGW